MWSFMGRKSDDTNLRDHRVVFSRREVARKAGAFYPYAEPRGRGIRKNATLCFHVNPGLYGKSCRKRERRGRKRGQKYMNNERERKSIYSAKRDCNAQHPPQHIATLHTEDQITF
jgi:hypothetical protein